MIIQSGFNLHHLYGMSVSVFHPSYLAAQMLPQTRPAGGALVNDWLFGAEDCVALRGIFFITGINDQPAHFDEAIPVILMEVG